MVYLTIERSFNGRIQIDPDIGKKEIEIVKAFCSIPHLERFLCDSYRRRNSKNENEILNLANGTKIRGLYFECENICRFFEFSNIIQENNSGAIHK